VQPEEIMARRGLGAVSAIILGLAVLVPVRAASPDPVRELQNAFEEYSGARLVFSAEDLPAGHYHDAMPSLSPNGQRRAAEIAVREIHKLPAGYLHAIGLQAVGIFQACVSLDGDGFRPYDEKLKGYRYYGIWNGKNALAAAFYSEQQLPLTLHHEIFHHVDSTLHARTDVDANLRHDERYQAIAAGKRPYEAAAVAADDLRALQKVSRGAVLETLVSEYARKNPGEDKAETARYLMSNLPDALVQVATRPELPGSQRLLHVLHKYEQAPASDGPALAWFVNVALGRQATAKAEAPPVPAPAEPPATAKGVAATLRALAERTGALPDDDARALLDQAEALAAGKLDAGEARDLARAAAAVTVQLLRQRIQPRDGERAFTIWGKEDADGVNRTLRADLAAFGRDVVRLKQIAAGIEADRAVAALEMQDLRLLARYYRFIAGNWSVSGETRRLFEQDRADLVTALPAEQGEELRNATALEWTALAESISPEGRLLPAAPAPAPRRAAPEPAPEANNPYLAKVDAEVKDPRVRAAIRRVQPACVRINGASGVNIAARGLVLTAAHVAERLGAKMTATFPDGQTYKAVCTAFDSNLDLAVCTLDTSDRLPFAALSASAPEVGDRVVCIGQPGRYTPEGKPTGYQPFTVSVGSIRGFVGDPLGNQSLGRTKHDAWTYWGHSGSPLFNEAGQVVGLHNSWDSKTAMRHAVTYQAIVHFLREAKIDFTTGE
jgi:hypothetical protein